MGPAAAVQSAENFQFCADGPNRPLEGRHGAATADTGTAIGGTRIAIGVKCVVIPGPGSSDRRDKLARVADNSLRFSPIPHVRSVVHGSVHLHHEPGWQSRAAQARHSTRHNVELLSGREDRRAGFERLRQVHPAQDHVRTRQGNRRRSAAAGRHQSRLPASGAAAR